MKVLICLTALAFPQDEGSGPPDFVKLAEVRTSALEDSVRAWPDEARETVRSLVVRLAGETTDGRAATLRVAERIAGALATTLLDSLQWHRVQFATKLDSRELSYLARADSLRVAGNNALFAEGVATALAAWRQAYQLFESVGDSTGMTSVLGNIGAGFYVDGQPDSAVAYLEQTIELARTIGHFVAEGNANVMLGNLANDRGDLQQATVRYGQAVRIHSRIGNQRGLAADFNNLGLVAKKLGDLDRARESFEAALAINAAHGWDGGAGNNLINLGNVDLSLSDFESAQAKYREAVERYRAAGQPFKVADALYNTGELLIRMANYPAAHKVMFEALEVYRDVDAPDGVVQVQLAIATVHSATGDIQRATDALREADATLQRAGIDDPGLAGTIELARGDLALVYNQLDVASAAYERSGRLFAREQDAFGVAQTLEGRGILALLRDEPAEATPLLTRAQSVFEDAGDVRASAWVGLQAGHAALLAGDTALARSRFELSAAHAMRGNDAAGEAQAHLGLGEVALEHGLILAAQQHFEQAIDLVADAVPAVEWEARARLAETLTELGQTDAASDEYLRAIALVESVASRVRTDDRRAAYLSDKWHVYRQLVDLELSRGNPEEAFAVSERLRARRTLELLANGTIPWRDDGETTAREQQLRQRITHLTAQLQGSNGEPSVRGPDISERSLVGVREALVRAQGEYANLLSDLRDESPAYASAVTGEPASLRDVQQALLPREVMLEYLLHDGSLMIFGLTADTVVTVSAPADRLALTALVDFARDQIVGDESSQRDGLWRTALTRLHDQLIRPVEQLGILAGRDRLILVPYGELHYLPFDALIDRESGRYLVEDYEISLAPSATVWLELRGRSSDDTRHDRVLALAPRVDVLPGTGKEVQAIGRHFGSRATVVMGREATESFFERESSAYDVVHLATYGVLNKHNPLFSYVDFSDADGRDGRLEVHEVFSLNLNASLVVLSACQTGLGSGALADVSEGDDWVGLVQAFLAAGANGTIATLWPVEDRRSVDLMNLFYANLIDSGDPIAALTAAKRSAIADDELGHPYAWAGYTVTGGWR